MYIYRRPLVDLSLYLPRKLLLKLTPISIIDGVDPIERHGLVEGAPGGPHRRLGRREQGQGRPGSTIIVLFLYKEQL